MNIFKKLTGKSSTVSNDRETPSHVEKDKKLMENLTEHQVDKLVDDSFPASDPAGTY